MRKIITFLTLILFVILTIAQPPQKMSYQAVVRDAGNLLVTNRTIGVRISILKSFPNGISVYTETHQIVTNGNGLMSLQIGTGNPTPGSNFAAIDWGNDDFYLQSEVDFTGRSNYTVIGTQQLITVPYAFFAGTADYNQLQNRPPSGGNTGDILYWNTGDSSWHLIPAGVEGEVLSMGPNGIPRWSYGSGINSRVPTISTDSVFDITGRMGLVAATIVDPGSTGIIASGVCWSINPYPSLGNSYTTDGTSVGSFVSNISGLTSGTTYYVRAYATNAGGTSYGAPISFTTPTHCGMLTDYDGNVYNTIYIGAQCWMKENLKTTHYSNGASITRGSLGTNYFGTDKYYFIYNDADTNKNIYGLLYTWAATMNGAGSSNNNPSGIQGICPSGWHLPSNTEWCELENYVEPGIDINCNTSGYRGSMAKKLTSPAYWISYPSNSFAPGYWSIDATGFNTSGFSAIPSGYYYGTNSSNYNYSQLNQSGTWWTCTIYSGANPYIRTILYSSTGISLSWEYIYYYAYSVRCIKN